MEIKCLRLSEMTYSVCESNLRVKYVLPGETAHFLEQKGKAIPESDIIIKSPHRTKVICPIFYECGGCDFLHISYNEQLKMKENYVKEIYQSEKVHVHVLPVIESKQPLYYRHKVVLSAGTFKQKLRLGLYREHSRRVIPFLRCYIQDKTINLLMQTIEELLIQFKIPAYDLDKDSGMIKHVMVRKSYSTNKLMLIFVTNGTLFPNQKTIIQEILKKHPLVSTVIQNIHKKKTHLVLLDEEKVLYGPGFIEDEIEEVKFRLSSKSFYQVNPLQMLKLYQTALELAKITKDDIVMDTYSGVGTISLLAAKRAKQVIAIEANPMAHLDAVHNKKLNKIDNVVFHQSDVEPFMNTFNGKVDIMIMDPTRDGATQSFIDAVLKLKPKRIVYISCEPKTQARDVKLLSKDYFVVSVQPVDMFSQTVHVESISLLLLK